jgi:hypothetical protein
LIVIILVEIPRLRTVPVIIGALAKSTTEATHAVHAHALKATVHKHVLHRHRVHTHTWHT